MPATSNTAGGTRSAATRPESMAKPLKPSRPTFHQLNRPDEDHTDLPDDGRTTADLTHERNARQALVRRRERELAGIQSTLAATKRRRNSGHRRMPSAKRPRITGERRSEAGYKAQEKTLKKAIRTQNRRIREIEDELAQRNAEWMPNS